MYEPNDALLYVTLGGLLSWKQRHDTNPAPAPSSDIHWPARITRNPPKLQMCFFNPPKLQMFFLNPPKLHVTHQNYKKNFNPPKLHRSQCNRSCPLEILNLNLTIRSAIGLVSVLTLCVCGASSFADFSSFLPNLRIYCSQVHCRTSQRYRYPHVDPLQ